MNTLEQMPFKAHKAVFEKLEEIAKMTSLNAEEHELYWKSINAYRTYLSVQEAMKAEGREEGLKNVARTMKQDGMPTDVISKYTGLSPDEIEKL